MALFDRDKAAARKERQQRNREMLGQRAAQVQGKLAAFSAAHSGIPDDESALFSAQSHEAGRNSQVRLYDNRLERVRAARLGSLSKASQDAEVTPLRAISSVESKKDGMILTKVTVFASGNNIEFRLTHADAARFKAMLTELLVSGQAPRVGASATAAAPSPSKASQIKELAELRDSGALTDDEFNAEKAKILGS